MDSRVDAAQLPARRRIVVVEDDAEIREVEVFLLGAEGYQVTGVSDGADAVPAVARERADLVVLDLMLPHRDGNQILQELARTPETASVPVIVASAFVERLHRTPQVKRVLAKPFEVTELLDAVALEIGRA